MSNGRVLASAVAVSPGGRVVSAHEILEALRTLDKLTGEQGASWAQRQVRRASIEAFRANRMRRQDRGGNELPH